MRKMNDNTTQGKKTYSASDCAHTDTSDDDAPEGWIDLGPVPEDQPDIEDYSLVLQQLKKEFAIAYIYMIGNPPRIIDMPTATDEAVELKRRGEYVKSSRFYADYMRDNGILTPMMAMAWFKCLAAGGDTQDAFLIAEYLMSRNPPECYAKNMLQQHMQTLKQLIEMREKRSLLQYLGQLSGNPQYMMAITDVDVFVNEDDSTAEDNNSEKSDSYGVAIRHHIRDIDDALLHREAIHRYIDNYECILTPAHLCYLSTDPNQQFGHFIVGARMQIDSIKVHLCLEQNQATGKFDFFWVGAFGRLDGNDLEPALYHYLAKLVPDVKSWIINYIFER